MVNKNSFKVVFSITKGESIILRNVTLIRPKISKECAHLYNKNQRKQIVMWFKTSYIVISKECSQSQKHVLLNMSFKFKITLCPGLFVCLVFFKKKAE